MTRKWKGKSQYVDVEPSEGIEIRKLLGHIISNPYSPTDYCISTDEHPYLLSLQDAVTEILQDEITTEWTTRRQAITILKRSITEEEFQKSLRDSLIRCLRSDNTAFRSIITIRRFENIITLVLQRYFQILLERLLSEIIAMRERAPEQFGRSLSLGELPDDEARGKAIFAFKSVLQSIHTKLMKLEGTISRRLLHYAMQTFPHNHPNTSDFDEVVPMPNCAMRAVLEELPPSSLDTAVFADPVTARLENVITDFRTMLPEYISGKIMENRPTDENRRIDPAIQQLDHDLQQCLEGAINARNLQDDSIFIHDVQNLMNDVQLHEMQQCAHAGRRSRLCEAVEDLRRQIKTQITDTVHRRLTSAPARDPGKINRLMDKLTVPKLVKLIEERQKGVCIATQLLKAESCLTSDQAEFLERNNTQNKAVIIRRVGQYPDIFRALKSREEYGNKLKSLLNDRGAAYLVTSTYSYLEVEQGNCPFHEFSGLNICGMAAAEDVPFIGTGYPDGLLQCGFAKCVARDEVLFGMVIHKITLGPIKGALCRAWRFVTHGVSCEPHLDKAQISHEPHSIHFIARAF